LEPDLNARAAPDPATEPAAAPAAGPTGLLATAARGSVRWETGLGLLVVAIIIFGAVTSPQFLTSGNFFNTGVTSGEIAIMALPMTLIIISGEIDLSVASILGMSSALLGVRRLCSRSKRFIEVLLPQSCTCSNAPRRDSGSWGCGERSSTRAIT